MAKGKGHARWTMSLFRVFPEHPLVTSTPTYWPERHPSCEGPWRGSTSHWGRGSCMRSGFCYTDGAMTLNPPSPGSQENLPRVCAPPIAVAGHDHYPPPSMPPPAVLDSLAAPPPARSARHVLVYPPSAPRLPYSQLLAHNVNWRH